MIGMQDNKFFDTSVLVYAFDKSDATKHTIALKLVQDVYAKSENGVISGQVLLELYNVLTRFVRDPFSEGEARSIINDFFDGTGWMKINHDLSVARRAVDIAANHKAKIWDTLIAETMKENGITTIVTENEKDFKRIPGINVLNPFK